MNADPPGAGGWFDSLRRIGESCLALLRNRFELFSVEWQEEKLRLLNLLVWLGLAAALGAAGVLIAVMTLAIWLWAVWGYAGLIGLAVVTLAAAYVILWRLRKKIQAGPPPFSQTVAEFRKDGACLRKKN